MTLVRVAILGGGYAGVRAVQEILRHDLDAEIVLVDRGHYHQVVTEMYKVAAGAEQPSGVQFPLRRLLPASPRLMMLQAEVQSLDPRERIVRTDRGTVPYKRLVLALGSAPEYYGVAGAEEHALTLRYLDSAVRVRRRLRSLRASGGGRVVIVGGGLTGVQLAGEIADHLAKDIHISIVQATPAILPEEDEELASYVERELVQHNIKIYRGEPASEVLPHSVKLTSGCEIPSDLTIWTGGVRANQIPQEAGLPCDGRGRVLVDAQLEVEGHPGVFAAGDIAHIPSPDGKHALPPTAQLAVQEGLQAGRNIVRVLRGDEPQALHARVLGTAAAIGDRHGIANIGRFRLTGRAGHAMHELALLRYLYGVGGLGLLRREAYLSWSRPPREELAAPPQHRAGSSA